jgi:protein-disulfide isomerase
MRLLSLILISLLSLTASAFAGVVNLQELITLQLNTVPKQITSTVDGRRLYVLTQDSQILVYSLAGDLQGTISVDPDIDHISPLGPQHLLLQKTGKKQAVVAMLEISQQIDISNSPFRGAESAPITIAIYDDFECPYCAKSVPLLKQVVDQYADSVKLVFKNFPLGSHRNSRNAALTALAANRQGKFWELHDLLFENFNSLNPKKIDDLAAQTGLDMEQLKKDRIDPGLDALITRDINEGTAIGVHGTPTIFINGRLLQERSLAGFSRLIEDELRQVPPSQAAPQE